MKRLSTALLAFALATPAFAGVSETEGSAQSALDQAAQVEKGGLASPTSGADLSVSAVDETQSDAIALYGISLANVAIVKVSALAVFKPVLATTRTGAINIIKAHFSNETQIIPLAREIGIKLGGVPSYLASFQQALDTAVATVLAADSTNFEAVYTQQKDGINQSLVAVLADLKSGGFTNVNVANFVDATTALANTESP